MPEYTVEGAELKKLMALAKRQELPFAFNPGKADDEHYFAMHRKRPQSTLGKVAKKEGPGSKAAFGTCKVEGSVLWLTCDEIVPGMAKKLKKFLKLNKVSLAVKVAAADGSVLEDDGEPIPEGEDYGPGAEGGARPPASKDEMGTQLAEIRDRLKRMTGGAAKSLLGEVENALSTLAYQGEEAIRATIERIEETLESAEEENAEEEAREDAEREALTERAETLLRGLAEDGSSGAKRLITQVEYILTKLASAPLDGLREALDKVEAAARALLPEGTLPEAGAAEEESGENPDKPRTKEDMTTALGTLKDRLARMAGEQAKVLKGEIESVLGTIAYQSEAVIDETLKRLEKAAEEAAAAADKEQDKAAEELEQLRKRLAQAYKGLEKLEGPALARIKKQADYLAERIEKNVIDGVANAMDGLERALRDVLPEGWDKEEEEQAGGDAPAADDGGTVNPLAELSAKLREIAASIASLPAEVQTRLKKAMAAVIAKAKSGDLGSAREGLQQIEAAVARALAAATATASASASAEDPKTAKLLAAIGTLRTRLGALPPGTAAASLAGHLDAAEAQARAGEHAAALAALKTLQEAIPLAGKIDALSAPVADALSAGAVTDPNRLRLTYDMALESLGALDLGKTRSLMAEVQRQLSEGGNDAERKIDPDVQPFATSAVHWRQTRGQLQAELGKLEKAIVSQLRGDAELAPILAETQQLFTHIARLDNRLDTALDAIVTADPGAPRDTARGTARQLLEEYKAELQNPFFGEVDSSNGFTPVAVAATASAALSQIEQVLGNA